MNWLFTAPSGAAASLYRDTHTPELEKATVIPQKTLWLTSALNTKAPNQSFAFLITAFITVW